MKVLAMKVLAMKVLAMKVLFRGLLPSPMTALLLAAALLLLLSAAPVLAGIPTPALPAGLAEGSTNWLDAFKFYFKAGLLVVATVLSGASFVWVSWMALAKFNEARNGRAEWGEAAMMGGGGVVMLLLTGFLLTQAVGII